MPQHEHLTLRTPITDAKRIIMMRHRDKYSWQRIAYEMNLSPDQCKRRYNYYTEIMQRLNAMTLPEIAAFIRTHETFHQRYLGENKLANLPTRERRTFDGVHDTDGSRGRKASRR